MPRKPTGQPAVPPDVTRVLERFEDWRKRKQKREKIPGELWSAAVALCSRHSVNRVSKWLRLNHSDLRQQVDPGTARGPRRRQAGAAFLELIPTGEGAAAAASVEVENRRGVKMRIELRGASTTELATLARALWRGQA